MESRVIPANSDNCPSKAFTDRPDKGWYHESVDYVLETGLMNGMGKGKFEPDTTLNRAMVATVLYRLSGDKVSATNAFPDVPANEWYGEAVAWAQQKGIVTGFEDGTFRPMEEISRQDMALMLQRYAKTVKGTDTTPTGDLSRWPDAGQVGSWAVDALRWCVGAGDFEQVKYYTKHMMRVEYLCLIASNLIVILALPFILSVYNLSDEAAQYANDIILYHAACVVTIWPLSFTLPNTLRAAADVKVTMVLSIISMWVFRFGFSYLLTMVFHMGIFGVWVAMTIDWLVRGIFFVCRYKSGRWQKIIFS